MSRNGILSAAWAAAIALTLQIPALADIDLLRAIPLEIKGYEVTQSFPAHFSTAAQVLSAIDSTPNLLVRMEVIRRAYHNLDSTEAEALLAALLKRHQLNENDLTVGFNHGYAQLVFKDNKTGLFFLRKANDRLQNQFSSLAYAMAQAQADINLEQAAPDQMTTRKMDVTYKLTDAVKFDAANHQPGFWPSYIRVLEQLKTIPAYGSFPQRDFSLVYLPYGNSVVPMRGATSMSIPLQNDAATLFSNALKTSCDPENLEGGDSVVGSPISQKTTSFGGDSATIQFFNAEEPGQYRVRVLSNDGRLMLSFRTYAMPNIVEDLEGDGSFEIVARQYKQDPLQPVLVYRYTPCGFELDKKVFELFR